MLNSSEQTMSLKEGHRTGGTNYQEGGVSAYAANRHGPDGGRFLDPVFTPYLTGIRGDVVDIGCGAGPWTRYAVDHGARRVLAVDYQQGMLTQAQREVARAGITDRVVLARADGASLPAPDSKFSLALSINVGCNLPTTSIAEHNGNVRAVGFEPHFTEMARVLEDGGRAVVTAPTSFGEIFTRGNKPRSEVMHSIEQTLRTIGDSQDAATITANLNTLSDVYRATFAQRGDHLVLVTDENELQSGEKIWRKLPGLTVPNFYHNEEEYLAAA